MNWEERLADIWIWVVKIWNITLFSSGENDIRLNQIIIALLTICLGVIISKRLTRIVALRLEKGGRLTHQTSFVLQKVISYLLLVITVLIALPIAGIPVTIFTVMGGALAIGVGFGAQNLFNNLISGIILMVERPIRVGDIVEHESVEGRVADIGNRCVRIRRTDGIDVLVPNSYFLEQKVVNWTLFDSDIRGKVSVGIAYGSDTKLARDILGRVARAHPDVLSNKEVPVLFEEFGDNALTFSVQFWTHVTRPMDLRRIQSDIRYEIDDEFKKAGIVIAFPQRDLHLDTLKPLEVRIQRDASNSS